MPMPNCTTLLVSWCSSVGERINWTMKQIAKAYELMGDEQSKFWAKTLLIPRKFYTKVGWIEGELSYTPAPN